MGETEWSIAQQIETVRQNMKQAAEKSGRAPSEVTLMAVTKTVDVDRINEAVRCGITDIGENRVQELLAKYDGLLNREQLHIHLIGRLQSNKVKYIVDKVDLIHSVDSVKLLQEIEKQAGKIGKRQEVLFEVNLSGEEQKGGFSPEEVWQVLETCGQYRHILVKGLMTVPPVVDSMSKNSHYFCKLRQMFIDISAKKYDNVSMSILSMGMSADYDIAIENGSTIVRVGSAIFGKRK